MKRSVSTFHSNTCCLAMAAAIATSHDFYVDVLCQNYECHYNLHMTCTCPELSLYRLSTVHG